MALVLSRQFEERQDFDMLIQILLAVVTLTVGNGGDVATPAEALVKVREWRKSGKVQQNEVVEVRLKAETFELTETLKFGNHDHDIVFCGADGMTSVISGGIELDRFSAGSDGIWRAKVPAGMLMAEKKGRQSGKG